MGAVAISKERTMAHLQELERRDDKVVIRKSRIYAMDPIKPKKRFGPFLGTKKRKFDLSLSLLVTDSTYEFFDFKERICYILFRTKRTTKKEKKP